MPIIITSVTQNRRRRRRNKPANSKEKQNKAHLPSARQCGSVLYVKRLYFCPSELDGTKAATAGSAPADCCPVIIVEFFSG